MALTEINSISIKDDSIVNADIKSDAAIAGTKLADNAVGLDQMAGIARGKLIVGDSSGDPAYLAAGSNDQVLTMDANGDVGWEAAAAGGAALTGSTNNTITTVTGADAIQGEAYLTFNGTGDLTVTGDENTAANLILVSDQSDNTADEWRLSSQVDNLFSIANDDSGSFVNKVEMHKAGNVTIKEGNLVIGTAGKGIDFSAQTATSATGGTATSELLDHYEEGTWTPVFTGSGTDPTYTNWHTTGTYIRVGGVCHVWYDPISVTFSGTDSSGYGSMSGFPFASTDNGSLACGQMVDILKWAGAGNLRDSGFSMSAAGASGQFHTAAPSIGFTWDNGNASDLGYFDIGGSYKCV